MVRLQMRVLGAGGGWGGCGGLSVWGFVSAMLASVRLSPTLSVCVSVSVCVLKCDRECV